MPQDTTLKDRMARRCVSKTAVIELGPHLGWGFWLGIVLTGIGTGASAAALTLVLQVVQHFVWPGAGATLLDAAEQATPWRHILVLLGAGLGRVLGRSSW